MKRLFVISLLIASFVGESAFSATRPASPRGRTTTSDTATSAPAVSARAAVGSRTTPRTGTKQTTQKVATRSATPTTKTPGVVARAATTQKVISTGTKVATATKNTTVNDECKAKYYGCMDSFCMLDNATGGRCLCSNRNQELSAILAEIEKLDQRSYQMATFGVEKIEMGENAEDVIANADKVTLSILNDGEDSKKPVRKKLDLSAWNTEIEEIEEDIFGTTEISPVDGKEGDALYRAASELCIAQVPECASDLSMLQLMYAQAVKSDCTAFENSLKQQKNASQQKLYAAESALRSAALEQYENANKYDLGQCTVEFKKCMQTTAGCGDDFSACATIAGIDNSASTRKSTSGKTKNFKIKGEITDIEISASTYDALMAKKPICENITKSCVKVAGQVWDTFLREVAPQVKNAELIAENNARQDCIGNISSCFQKACKDNIDPKDPDGSYDMCLTHPGTMLNLCKVPLNTCGIDSSSESKASENPIWDYVLARLAAMRVDACTTAVKDCLTDENVCGDDYTQCIGLDTDTIIRMCPYDKLVACQQKYGETDIQGQNLYNNITSLIQGILLNIDNNFLTECQNAADQAMIKVCGSNTDCNVAAVSDGIGARTLEYKICRYKADENGNIVGIDYDACRTDIAQITDYELGRVRNSKDGALGAVAPLSGVLDGVIYWEQINPDDDGKFPDIDDYLKTVGGNNVSALQKERIATELKTLQNTVNATIEAIESDPTVQYCMTGRKVQGMVRTDSDGNQFDTIGRDNKRFPKLTLQMRKIIANSALKKAKDNYYKKYDELYEKMMQDYATIGERVAEIAGENALDARREIARQSCVGFAEGAALPKSAEPPKNSFGKIMGMVAMLGMAVAMPLTGVATVAAGAAISTSAIVTTAAIGAAGVGTATIGLAGNAGSKSANGQDTQVKLDLVGTKSVNNWNYKETNTATFDWETLRCQSCVRIQQCTKPKNPLFGNKYCDAWADPIEACRTIQF